VVATKADIHSDSGQPESSLPRWPAWHDGLADYRQSSTGKAVWQLLNTAGPYVLLWYLMILTIRHDYPYAVTLLLAVVAAAFLVRLFILFHDCVHGSLFPRRGANTFFGYLLGVLLFTPFEDWRFSHLRHHATFANLDTRGFGDVWTLTRAEYNSLPKWHQRFYRFYRNPLVMTGLGAIFSFVLRFRLPTRAARRRERSSVLLTNSLLVSVALTAGWAIGWRTYLLIQIPVLWMAGAAGIWLFYVQHQFRGVYWARKEEWHALPAAMEGCSFYQLPTVLRWFSGNIGYHHIHHLGPRIPGYRLKECYEAIPALREKAPLTIRESLSTIHLKLWDEDRGELVGFGAAAEPPSVLAES
jgi:omega-6 fatty acid desaturase (delta-12 desaturase)